MSYYRAKPISEEARQSFNSDAFYRDFEAFCTEWPRLMCPADFWLCTMDEREAYWDYHIQREIAIEQLYAKYNYKIERLSVDECRKRLANNTQDRQVPKYVVSQIGKAITTQGRASKTARDATRIKLLEAAIKEVCRKFELLPRTGRKFAAQIRGDVCSKLGVGTNGWPSIGTIERALKKITAL